MSDKWVHPVSNRHSYHSKCVNTPEAVPLYLRQLRTFLNPFCQSDKQSLEGQESPGGKRRKHWLSFLKGDANGPAIVNAAKIWP